MNNLYNWIILVIFVFLFGWIIISNNKYSKLENRYYELINNDTSKIDSLLKANKQSEQLIIELEDSIYVIETQLVELMHQIKSVEKETFEVSSNFTESTILLQENLKCINL